jgi:4-carboxymuconolactone decarboxylase
MHGMSPSSTVVPTSCEQLYASANADETHIQHLLSANCFGDHLTRTGIDLKTRELLTFSMLISLGGCEPQAKGHRKPECR